MGVGECEGGGGGLSGGEIGICFVGCPRQIAGNVSRLLLTIR